MMFHLLMSIERISIRSQCAIFARDDGVTLNGSNYRAYIESLIEDASGREWVSIKHGYKYIFTPIVADFGVSEWMDDEPMSELCPNILDNVSLLFGDDGGDDIPSLFGGNEGGEVVTVWKAKYVVDYNYFGDDYTELELEMLGEVDYEKLHLIVQQENDG